MEEATSFSGMSADFQQNPWNYVPEDRTFHNHCCEKLKFYTFLLSTCNLFFTSRTVKTSKGILLMMPSSDLDKQI
jgi:hypothetical protein